MKSVRLNKAIRTAITSNAVTKLDLELQDAMGEESRRAYAWAEGAVPFELKRAFELYPTYITTTSCVVDDKKLLRDYREGHWSPTRGDRIMMPFPVPSEYGNNIPLSSFPDAAVEELKDLHCAVGNAIEARDTGMKKVQDILSSCATVSKLREIWPECEQFLPPSAATPEGSAIARKVGIAELNELLKIGDTQ